MNNSTNLVFWVPFCGGGLCDRIMGLCSTRVLADILGKNFLIKWDFGDMSNVFTIREKYVYNSEKVDHSFPDMDNEVKSYLNKEDLPQILLGKSTIIWTNYNVLNYLNENIKKEWDVKTLFIREVQRVFSEYFLIKDEIFSLIQNDIRERIGIHIRTLDKFMTITNKVIGGTKENMRLELHKLVKEKISCLVDRFPKGEKLFVCGDSEMIGEIVSELLPDCDVVYTEGEVVNSGYSDDKMTTSGLKKVISDLISLCHTRELYYSYNTNFSRVPALFNHFRDMYCIDKDLKVLPIDHLITYHSESRFRM